MNIKHKTAQSLILANTLLIGLPGLADAHGDVPEQDVTVQRQIPSDRATSNANESTGREEAVRRRGSNPGSGTSRDSGSRDRSSQSVDIGRDDRSVGRQNQDWGADRSDDHGGAH